MSTATLRDSMCHVQGCSQCATIFTFVYTVYSGHASTAPALQWHYRLQNCGTTLSRHIVVSTKCPTLIQISAADNELKYLLQTR
jgi:hypothetical protein